MMKQKPRYFTNLNLRNQSPSKIADNEGSYSQSTVNRSESTFHSPVLNTVGFLEEQKEPIIISQRDRNLKTEGSYFAQKNHPDEHSMNINPNINMNMNMNRVVNGPIRHSPSLHDAAFEHNQEQ